MNRGRSAYVKNKKANFKSGVGCLAIFAAFLSAVTFYVEMDVQRVCDSAVKRYPGNKIDAIIQVAQEADLCTKEKSRALWALGQLGDERRFLS